MNILFAASEAVPFAKTGGLGDVVGALPKALAAQGMTVSVIMPHYGEIKDDAIRSFRRVASFTVKLGWRNQACNLLEGHVDGIRYYLIVNDYYYKRGTLYGYDDEAERYAFFCFAVLEGLRYIDERPAIIHCHDWQTGIIPFLLKTRYRDIPLYRGIRSLFTIHNLRYQGVFSQETLCDLLGVGRDMFTLDKLEFYGGGSCMKAGILYADKLTTVSRTYAEEIQTPVHGEKLDGVLRLRSPDLTGIVNGIDTDLFDPMRDPAIAFPYRTSIAKKRKNKAVLQRELGLDEAEDVPVLAIVSRLVEQKGLDLLEGALEGLLAESLQLVVLGSGEARYEELFARLASEHPRRVAVRFGFDDALARRIYAGSDIYLMPSQFEPCGLSQLLALRYGTVPLVRETGGLKDTVQAYDEYTGNGTGFSFRRYHAADFLLAVRRALTLYRNAPEWQRIVDNGAQRNYSWSASARDYAAVYRELAGNG
ncbi:glycogen synthase [Paenibacillus darwinianus]|uniref:Glycogen synthase n=1 Tax=Paenibacillus darwinianus TaxID=1380763 RepID=A0A9W5W8H0_9BACL|nr:glycogen synthase GlgA [Paenibacillus darwinianus]EXX90362.1 glycogen synthase [Paenibacillus darwinianus]EXX91010.1 glycogen synthase [Paenibacillus darwinianus]